MSFSKSISALLSSSSSSQPPQKRRATQNGRWLIIVGCCCCCVLIGAVVFPPSLGYDISKGSSYFEKGSTESSSSENDSKQQKPIPSKHQLLNIKECTNKEDKTRWSNKPHTKSPTQSIFNCDLPDAMCRYYYPANFLEASCGLGRGFVSHKDIAISKQKDGTLWNHQQSVGFSTLTMNELCIDDNATTKWNQFIDHDDDLTAKEKRGKNTGPKMILSDIGEQRFDIFVNHTIRCLTERLSFLHVHKAGGSSLQSAFYNLERNRHYAVMSCHTHFIPREDPRILCPGMQNVKAALNSLQKATKYPSDGRYNPGQHVIFAVVRDPIERFISSIGQALGGVGSEDNKVGYKLMKKCVKSTSRESLTCLAKYIRDNGYWMEIHFMPQVIDIGFTTMWQDVPIAVFPMKPHLQSVLSYLGAGGSDRGIHFRDGSKPNYRGHPLLTNMTVDDYDEESLEIVCNIYEMDVRMQRSLGMDVPRCDPYILKKDYDFEF